MADRDHRILCIDDEPNVLEGLALHLGRRWKVTTATSGSQALAILVREGPFSVVMSDMRMPGMDGVELLTRVRRDAPETVRVLLTGQADLEAAIHAVNEGQIFRFLTKPCPPAQLLGALGAAVHQYHLVTAEKILLEQTLRGSIKALMDVLALANPQAFGRANRIRSHVLEIARRRGVEEIWPIEVAAMLSQIGCVTLPAETVEKIYRGGELTPEEKRMADRLPEIAEKLLEGIPRIDAVREILARAGKKRKAESTVRADDVVALGAEALRIALDLDALEARKMSRSAAIDALCERGGAYDPDLLRDIGVAGPQTSERRWTRAEIPLSAVEVGMVFDEDVRHDNGVLLVARGYEVTPGFIERVSNSRAGIAISKIRVLVPDEAS